MYQLATLLTLSGVAIATSLGQRPLVGEQTPLIKPKQLVNSTVLEAHILGENLLKRANDLYKIAELGIDEYNHPTRVIGSKGMELLILTPCLVQANFYVTQDTLLQ